MVEQRPENGREEKGESVAIKGTSDGLIITLGPGPLFEVLEEMESRLSAKASFFRGGRVALRVADRPLSAEQLQSIGTRLEGFGVSLWAVESEHPTTHTAAEELGLEVSVHPVTPPPAPSPDHVPREELPGLVLRRTLRSGQAVHHAGHVVLIGDTNPGAEIVAGGDVIIWGKLRGIVHAGAMGDETAVVCALQLAPSQIRIGSLIARPPDRGRPPKVPEMAHVQDGQIIVERWDKTR
ncbi:MAG: septum site-determining protein MinC [Anaerolineae bacterium]